MWENNDKKNYNLHKQHNVGQICNDNFSLKIRELAGMIENKTFLVYSLEIQHTCVRVFMYSSQVFLNFNFLVD